MSGKKARASRRAAVILTEEVLVKNFAKSRATPFLRFLASHLPRIAKWLDDRAIARFSVWAYKAQRRAARALRKVAR